MIYPLVLAGLVALASPSLAVIPSASGSVAVVPASTQAIGVSGSLVMPVSQPGAAPHAPETGAQRASGPDCS